MSGCCYNRDSVAPSTVGIYWKRLMNDEGNVLEKCICAKATGLVTLVSHATH